MNSRQVCPLLFRSLLVGSALFSPSLCAQTVLLEWQGDPAINFGRVVLAPGDVNGDGVPDVALGLPQASPNGIPEAGQVEVFSGDDGRRIFVLQGSSPSQSIGLALFRTGDIDRDGIADLLVSDGPIYGPFVFGTLKLISGATQATLRTFSGSSADSLGDIDGDGIPDLIIGNEFASTGQLTRNGQADVIAAATWIPLRTYAGTYSNEGLGGVIAIGDFDRDGVSDYFVSAPGHAQPGVPGSAPANGSWIYSGRDGELLVRTLLGTFVMPLGDIDGDGFSDIALLSGGGLVPQSWHFLGGPDGHLLFRINSRFPYLTAGGVGRTGDIDGDGADDYAYTHTAGGRPFLSIKSGRDRTELLLITDPIAVSLAPVPIGDTNGDDVPDLVLSGFYPNPFVTTVRLYSCAPDGVTPFGSGCPNGSGVTPRIGISHEPKLGETIRLNLTRVPHATPAYLVLGASNQSWLGTPLPIDLAALGLPGCPLLVTPDVIIPVHTEGKETGPAYVSYPLLIPSLQALQGGSLFAQFLVLTSDDGVKGAVTRGLQITIQ